MAGVITNDLTRTPRLVIPDIQPGGIIGYESGRTYPHHNVYWITSDTWISALFSPSSKATSSPTNSAPSPSPCAAAASATKRRV